MCIRDRFQMGSKSVHRNMVKIFGRGPAEAGPYVPGPYVLGPYVLWLVLFAVALVPRTTYAQPDVTGSWGATGNEDLAGDSVPVDYTGAVSYTHLSLPTSDLV